MIPEIVKDGTITVESIFDFTDYAQISSFMRKCRAQNCTVHFADENLTVTPAGQDNPGTSTIITIYSMIISYPQSAINYVRYLLKKHEANIK